jgi:hypothetical protein
MLRILLNHCSLLFQVARLPPLHVVVGHRSVLCIVKPLLLHVVALHCNEDEWPTMTNMQPVLLAHRQNVAVLMGFLTPCIPATVTVMSLPY